VQLVATVAAACLLTQAVAPAQLAGTASAAQQRLAAPWHGFVVLHHPAVRAGQHAVSLPENELSAATVATGTGDHALRCLGWLATPSAARLPETIVAFGAAGRAPPFLSL
jgi:hypothetical protein